MANLDGNLHLAGDLDQVEFYNGSLNAAQIGTLFNTDTIAGGSQQYLPTNTALNLAASGAGIDLNDNSQVIGSLKGVGGTNVLLGQGILTTGGDNTSTAFAGVISGSGGITKTGTGTFTMTGSNTYTGGTMVSAGKLIANNLSNGTITVTGGQAQLSVKANANDVSGTTVVPALSIIGGSFDITNNALVLTSANTSATTVRGYLHAGLLTTSSTAGGFAVGYADNATLGRTMFGGVSVDGSKLLVGLVYAGDSNLDGQGQCPGLQRDRNQFRRYGKRSLDAGRFQLRRHGEHQRFHDDVAELRQGGSRAGAGAGRVGARAGHAHGLLAAGRDGTACAPSSRRVILSPPNRGERDRVLAAVSLLMDVGGSSLSQSADNRKT